MSSGGQNKFDFKFVKRFFEKEGYTLLDDKYLGSDIKSSVICPKGHNWDINFSRFKKGVRCKYCSAIERGKYRKLSLSYVRSYFNKFGYKLLSNIYNTVEHKLNYECPNGHIHYMTFHNFKDTGNRW